MEAAAPDCTAEEEAALYENAATITGVSITVDGTTYTSGNVTITPDSSISYTVTGTNFAGLSADNMLCYASGRADIITSDYSWDINTDAGTATCYYTESISHFEGCKNFEVSYSNDGGENYVGTGIYLTYDDGGSTGSGDGGNDDGGSTGSDTPSTPVTIPVSSGDTPAYVTYIVQKGDTLSTIAKQYSCTIAEIVAANSDLIKNPDLIYTGWELKMPQD